MLTQILKNTKGLLPLEAYGCDHAVGPLRCKEDLDRIWLITRFGFGDLDDPKFSGLKRWVKFAIARSVVQNLQAMHSKGYAHRDMTVKNVLLVQLRPFIIIVLFDLGKAIDDAEPMTDPCLGPLYSLAPEIDGVTEYTNKIDVWSTGLLLAQFLGVYIPCQMTRGNEPICEEYHGAILRSLDAHATRETEWTRLFRLLSKMLAWSPDDRPSIDEVVESPAWTCLDQEMKRVYLENEDKDEWEASAEAPHESDTRVAATVCSSLDSSLDNEPRSRDLPLFGPPVENPMVAESPPHQQRSEELKLSPIQRDAASQSCSTEDLPGLMPQELTAASGSASVNDRLESIEEKEDCEEHEQLDRETLGVDIEGWRKRVSDGVSGSTPPSKRPRHQSED